MKPGTTAEDLPAMFVCADGVGGRVAAFMFDLAWIEWDDGRITSCPVEKLTQTYNVFRSWSALASAKIDAESATQQPPA
jgi:hypothetical protein